MNINEAPFLKELVQTCSNMYRLGWNERNGGNISMRLTVSEVEPYVDVTKTLRRIVLNFDASPLANSLFLVTGTGKYFKNVERNPVHNLGLIRVAEDGASIGILWGFSDGDGPTSELSAHFRSHIVRLSRDKEHRVVMHCHATNLLAMTYVHPLDDRAFTRSLWRASTECIVVFPEGVGVLPWILCGTDEIGRATARKMEDYRLCIWAQHGIFGAGNSLDEAFGLIETAEKAAEVCMKTLNVACLNTISDEQLRLLAESFKADYRKDFLSDAL
ncbi:MAG: rhamnulose-1-phosphate aldolase [Treponema sp.]|jgi:rhamnulose-1-phosphate aldolase|nr:rhamnulose-1-phosphate aldolase [Treponema sp.]